MTAISAILSKNSISISTDSLLTRYYKTTKKKEEIEHKSSKIVKMEKYRAAASFWGLAKYGNSWTLEETIRKALREAPKSDTLKSFALRLAKNLDDTLKLFNFKNPIESGIGIHITGFELRGKYDLPELYLVTNFENPQYDRLKPSFIALPQVYSVLKNNGGPNVSNTDEQRAAVNEYLNGNDWNFFNFNNGDPVVYNVYSRAEIDAMIILFKRYKLRFKSEYLRAIARRPIEGIRTAQRDFLPVGQRSVGGKIHDLVINRNGTYT